jgi:hypothetical protein
MDESDGIDEAIEGISRAGMSVAGRLAEQLANAHDSAARREALAASLDGVADREAVQARLSADQDQARPPSAAVAIALGRGLTNHLPDDRGRVQALKKSASASVNVSGASSAM